MSASKNKPADPTSFWKVALISMSIVRTRFSFQDASLIRSDDVPHALCNQHDVWQCSHEEIKSQDRLTAATLPLHAPSAHSDCHLPGWALETLSKEGRKFLRPPNIVTCPVGRSEPVPKKCQCCCAWLSQVATSSRIVVTIS